MRQTPSARARWAVAGAAIAAAGLLTSPLHATIPSVIFSTIPDHSTSLLPGSGSERITNLGFPYRSSDGNWWVSRFITDAPTAQAENNVFVRTGPMGSDAVFRGNTPVPGFEGHVFHYLDQQVRINSQGDIAAYVRSRTGTTGLGDWNIGRIDTAGDFHFVVRTGDPITQIPDASYGRLTDAVITDDGRVGYRASHIAGVPEGTEQALFLGDDLIVRKGIDYPTGQSGGQTTPYGGSTLTQGFVERYFAVTPDGNTWLTGAKVDRLDASGANEVYVLVVNNHVVLEEGQPIPGSTGVLQELNAYPTLMDNGDWFARVFEVGDTGHFSVGRHHLIRNGELMHITGDPVPDGEPGENFAWIAPNNANTFMQVQGNGVGDFFYTAGTDHPDEHRRQVLIFNDETILLRTGDEVDLTGDGQGDGLYIHLFGTFTQPHMDLAHFYPLGFLTDDLELTIRVLLRDEASPAGTPNIVGEAYITMIVPEPTGVVPVMAALGGLLVRRRRS